MVSPLGVRALGFEYPGPSGRAEPIRALDGVDLALEVGELLCVIGPNGSGKSTLLRCLAGLLRPTRGEVLWEGASLARLAPRERARRIAVVPQYLPELPDVRVHDFVLGGRYAHLSRWSALGRGAGPHDERAVAAALEESDAADLGERPMSTLSGGQRQRVLVARSVAQESPVLLVDEPTNSLDPDHQVRVFELLKSLAARGRTVVVVTHDLGLAGQYADRLALFDRGRVVATGGVEPVLVPEVLGPVYGPHLFFGRFSDDPSRPFVLPRRARGGPPG